MKHCPKCGRQMPDDARFCPGCRAYLPEHKQNGIKQFRCPRCGGLVERMSINGTEPAFGTCEHCGFPENRPEASVPMEPVHTETPRAGLRWWHIALPLALVVLLLGGLFLYRAAQHPIEEAWYSSGKAPTAVNFFSGSGEITGCEGYTDGEITYTKKYQETAACRSIDTAAVEDMDGVRKVVCLQVFLRKAGEESFQPDGRYEVFGYDKHGVIVAEQQFHWTGSGEPELVFTAEYERDAFGRPLSVVITAGEGEDFLSREFQPKNAFGLCTQADVTETQYGTLEYEDGTYTVDPYAAPRTVEFTVRYRY